jgi:hypothetical protein
VRARGEVQIEEHTNHQIYQEISDNDLELPGDWSAEDINKLMLPIAPKQRLEREGRIERLKEEFHQSWKGTGSWRKGLVTLLKICHPDVTDFETRYEDIFDVQAFLAESTTEDSGLEEGDEDADDDETREESTDEEDADKHAEDSKQGDV